MHWSGYDATSLDIEVVCVSLFYVIDTGSTGSRARHSRGELGCTHIYPPPLAQTLAMPTCVYGCLLLDIVCVYYCSVCFFVLCNRHRFNRIPGPPLAWRTGMYPYIPITLSSDAGYALPLTLLGAPVSIGALLKPGSRSLGRLLWDQDRDWSGPPPGPHVPFRHNRGSAAIHPSRSRD